MRGHGLGDYRAMENMGPLILSSRSARQRNGPRRRGGGQADTDCRAGRKRRNARPKRSAPGLSPLLPSGQRPVQRIRIGIALVGGEGGASADDARQPRASDRRPGLCLTGQQKPQQHACRIHIRSRVRLLIAELLRRGYGRCAQHLGVPGRAVLIRPGDAQINEKQLPFGGQNQVFGFNIPMDDGRVMGMKPPQNGA